MTLPNIPATPPLWSDADLAREAQISLEAFRERRMDDPCVLVSQRPAADPLLPFRRHCERSAAIVLGVEAAPPSTIAASLRSSQRRERGGEGFQ